MSKKEKVPVQIEEESEDSILGEETEPSGGGKYDEFLRKAKLIVISIIVATIVRYIDKPIAAQLPKYPIVDNLSTYYNWTFDHTLGFAGKLLYSAITSNKGETLIPLPTPSGVESSPPTNPGMPAVPEAQVQAQVQAQAEIPKVEPIIQCQDWVSCIDDFRQISGYLEWRYFDGTPYCYLQPANGDKFYVVGAVLGMEPTAWWTYYSDNKLTFPANEIYSGQKNEGLRIKDNTCLDQGLHKPEVLPPTSVPQVETQAPAQNQEAFNGQINEVSHNWPNETNATGRVYTTMIQGICVYVPEGVVTVEGIMQRFSWVADQYLLYYQDSYNDTSPQSYRARNGIEGFYFRNPVCN